MRNRAAGMACLLELLLPLPPLQKVLLLPMLICAAQAGHPCAHAPAPTQKQAHSAGQGAGSSVQPDAALKIRA